LCGGIRSLVDSVGHLFEEVRIEDDSRKRRRNTVAFPSLLKSEGSNEMLKSACAPFTERSPICGGNGAGGRASENIFHVK
jgi:hypothetical protein